MPRTHILRELTGKGLRLDKSAQLNKAGRVIGKTIKKVALKAKAPVIALKELVIKKEEPVEDFEKEELQQLELREDLGDDDDSDDLVKKMVVSKPVELHQTTPEKSVTTKAKKGKSSKRGSKKSKRD